MLGHEANNIHFNEKIVMMLRLLVDGRMGESIEQRVSWVGQLSIRQPH